MMLATAPTSGVAPQLPCIRSSVARCCRAMAPPTHRPRSFNAGAPSSAAAPGLRSSPPRRSVAAKVFNDPKNEDTGDRIAAALPYLLPLLDALPYAKFMMLQYPFIARAFAPLAPLMYLYHSFPFAPFLIFLAVYNGLVNNQSFPRFVRYNAMQAVLLDVLLIIPQVILNNVVQAPQDELGLQAYVTAYNTLFLFVAVCTAYGMGSCLVGQTARLPMVAEAADSQMRDF